MNTNAIILKRKQHERRAMSVRNKITGTSERPRLSVFRSLRNIYCQIIDDVQGKTLVAVSTKSKDVASQVKYGGNVKAAEVIGQKVAELAKQKGIQKVVFDRGGNHYHGRVKALADAARKGGLQF